MKYRNLIFLFSLLFFSCQPSAPTNMSSSNALAIIGTYTQKEGHVDGKGIGVAIYKTGPKSADWELLSSFSDIINPSYLCLSKKHPIIYAVSEQGPGVAAPGSVIKVLQVDRENKQMKELQSISALGDAPCHISIDRKGEYLFIANYVSGNVVQYGIKKDGTLTEGISQQHFGKGTHSRQKSPHAHFIQQHPTSEAIYAVDLGNNTIYQYQATPTGLVKSDSIQALEAGGPRHLVWHPKGENVFILNELNGILESWVWTNDQKERKQSLDLKPKDSNGFAGSAAVKISQSGEFIYVTLRGDFDELVVIKYNSKTEQLEVFQRIKYGGLVGRELTISPKGDYISVALQNSDRIMLFPRNKTTGLVKEEPEVVQIKTPVCIAFTDSF